MKEYQEPLFSWEQETGIASCTIRYKDFIFTGYAMCSPEDEDMKSKLTGQDIAYRRALIKYLIHVRDCELKPAIAALKQYYYTMKHSKYFKENSYEIIRFNKHLKSYEENLQSIKEEILEEKIALQRLILTKDAYYNKIREKRKKEGK